jgi:hypothetical protein
MTMELTVIDYPPSDSLLSPLLVGVHRAIEGYDFVDAARKRAGAAIPTVRHNLNVLFQGQKKTQGVAHNRTVLHGSDKMGNQLTRLCDQRAGENASDSWNHVIWEVSSRSDGNIDQVSALAQCQTLVQMAVTRYRIQEARVIGSTQLALFRHLVVEGLRGMDSDLIVIGGQHNWDDGWWTSTSDISL